MDCSLATESLDPSPSRASQVRKRKRMPRKSDGESGDSRKRTPGGIRAEAGGRSQSKRKLREFGMGAPYSYSCPCKYFSPVRESLSSPVEMGLSMGSESHQELPAEPPQVMEDSNSTFPLRVYLLPFLNNFFNKRQGGDVQNFHSSVETRKEEEVESSSTKGKEPEEEKTPMGNGIGMEGNFTAAVQPKTRDESKQGPEPDVDNDKR